MAARFRILILLVLWAAGIRAQDVHFSQFFMAPLSQNPALAGGSTASEATMNYRSQWKAITVPYKTYAFQMHGRFAGRKRKNYLAGGLQMYYDQSGDGLLRTTIVNLSLAGHVHISRYHTLGGGIQGGVGQRRIDYGALQWGSQYAETGYNPQLNSGESLMNPTFSYADMSGGFLWNFDNTAGLIKVQGNNFNRGTVGLSFFHFNQPAYSFNNTGERLMVKWVFHGNMLFSIPNSKLAINPGWMAYKQGPNREVLFGSMVRYDLLSESKYSGVFENVGAYLGAYYRWGDAIVVSSMIESGSWALGFSYDASLSNLRPASNGRGGFEISIRYKGDNSLFGKKINFR
jgi:type IX secretion system PorP/SprF family membrane protein